MTIELPTALEQSLRHRSAALGRPASELIGEALQAYLSKVPPQPLSDYALGEDLFGAHRGLADLSSRRKEVAADVWNEKQAASHAKAARPRRAPPGWRMSVAARFAFSRQRPVAGSYDTAGTGSLVAVSASGVVCCGRDGSR